MSHSAISSPEIACWNGPDPPSPWKRRWIAAVVAPGSSASSPIAPGPTIRRSISRTIVQLS